MPIPGVEGSSLIGKAPDVNRSHDSSQQQNLAAQAEQEAEAARRAAPAPRPGRPRSRSDEGLEP
jgi:hypothetical protein